MKTVGEVKLTKKLQACLARWETAVREGPSRVPVYFLTVDDQCYAVSKQLIPY